MALLRELTGRRISPFPPPVFRVGIYSRMSPSYILHAKVTMSCRIISDFCDRQCVREEYIWTLVLAMAVAMVAAVAAQEVQPLRRPPFPLLSVILPYPIVQRAPRRMMQCGAHRFTWSIFCKIGVVVVVGGTFSLNKMRTY